MLMVRNNASTENPTPEKIRLLMECDDITTCKEAGSFLAAGYKGSHEEGNRRRVVALHFNSYDHYMTATGQAPAKAYGDYADCGWDDDAPETEQDVEASPFRP